MHDPLRIFKAEFFKALAHPARIKILELLRHGEMSVTDLQEQLGIESSSVSQNLSVLRHKKIVNSRKVGTTVYYSVPDPAVYDMLDAARRIFNNQLRDTRSTLEQMAEEEETPKDLEPKRIESIHAH